jgi:hypothetical protein
MAGIVVRKMEIFMALSLITKPLFEQLFASGGQLGSHGAREARIYSARFVITWLGRSTALVFLQIFPIFAAKTAF